MILGIVSLISVIIGIRPFVMISESMHPEVPKNSLALLNTTSKMVDVAVGDNVGYVLGKVVAMHKVVSTSPGSPATTTSTTSTISTSSGENLSTGSTGSTGSTEVGAAGGAGEKTLVVKSLADDGESVVNASTYVSKEVLSIPGVGGWIRKALDYKWIVIIAAAVLIIIGCIPKGRQSHRKQKLECKTLARSAGRSPCGYR